MEDALPTAAGRSAGARAARRGTAGRRAPAAGAAGRPHRPRPSRARARPPCGPGRAHPALRPALRLARLRGPAAHRRHPRSPWWTWRSPPRSTAGATGAAADHVAAARAVGGRRPRSPDAGAAAPPRATPARARAPGGRAETYVEQGAGTLSVVDGTSPVHGTGPLRRFIVEVEDGIGVDGAAFAAAVEATLGDPRSWGSGGRMSFQRVGVAEAAAGSSTSRSAWSAPAAWRRYCPGVGTGGYTSCRYGDRAVINLARWATAVPHYDGDIATYRPYVVNHEVGHVLGNGHVDCPGPGQLAPVMQQQTLGSQGCVKNAWPYP